MFKTTLKEKLEKDGHLSCNIIASSLLIEKVEIFGFVNSCDSDMIVDEYKMNYKRTDHVLNGVVNRDCSNPIISSGYMYQVLEYFNGTAFVPTGVQFPIFKYLSKCTKDMELNVENLWIPSLWANSYYQKIKSRIGNGVVVNDNDIKKAKLPSTIFAKGGKAMLAVNKGSILMGDSDREISSVGDDILVVCRYVHSESGRLCYLVYGIDELFYEGL